MRSTAAQRSAEGQPSYSASRTTRVSELIRHPARVVAMPCAHACSAAWADAQDKSQAVLVSTGCAWSDACAWYGKKTRTKKRKASKSASHTQG